jgi:hypothetical protein
MRRGASLDHVDEQIIGPSELGEEREAALWLYAHSCVQGRRRYASRQAVFSRSAREGAPAAGTD